MEKPVFTIYSSLIDNKLKVGVGANSKPNLWHIAAAGLLCIKCRSEGDTVDFPECLDNCDLGKLSLEKP